MIMKGIVLIFSLASSLVQTTLAHRPALIRASCDGDYGSSTTALPLPDPSISWSFRHYADCTNRALWVQFENPQPDFSFYVGVGLPTMERFEAIRADALIIGPGLPALSSDVFNFLPEEIRNDPIWQQQESIGAYFHQSPDDQSTCSHLGRVMNEASTVRNGRCDFYEPFGQTHSWPILDADNNEIPIAGANYHVAIWSRQDVSTKLSVALGTWVEDFRTQFDIPTPTCERDLSDFSEKLGNQQDCFPVTTCPATVGCGKNGQQDPVQEPVCELGASCESSEGCEIGGVTYTAPVMGACGGELCPAAVKTWEHVNMRMHMGMMDLEYTGDVNVDFVRGMIPHHIGAVDMCKVLIQDLTCTEVEAIDNLEGLVHFCNHVQLEQDREVGGMMAWLEERGLADTSPCVTQVSRNADTMDGMAMTTMPESCGVTDATSSIKFIEANHKMHNYMSVQYSCDHSADFVRMMLPHHAGAIDMCDILNQHSEDEYLLELCSNITLTQRAEIAWMHEWLAVRNEAATAPCSANCEPMEAIADSCEDLLSTSSFCHDLGQDGFCRCEDAIADGLSCDEPAYLDGIGEIDLADVCKRTCGICSSDASVPIWPVSCSEGGHDGMDHGGHDMDDGKIDHSDMDHGDMDHDGMGHDGMDGTTDQTSNASRDVGMTLVPLLLNCCGVVTIILSL